MRYTRYLSLNIDRRQPTMCNWQSGKSVKLPLSLQWLSETTILQAWLSYLHTTLNLHAWGCPVTNPINYSLNMLNKVDRNCIINSSASKSIKMYWSWPSFDSHVWPLSGVCSVHTNMAHISDKYDLQLARWFYFLIEDLLLNHSRP